MNKYKIISLRTSKDFERAESLVEKGWKIINVGFTTLELIKRAKQRFTKQQQPGTGH